MRKELKPEYVEQLTEMLNTKNVIYLADVGELNSTDTSNLRRLCYKREVKLLVVKNALLRIAIQNANIDFSEFNELLKGYSALMFSENSSAPAKVIKEFRKTSKKPILKGAYIEESFYIGDELLDTLCSIKSKDELIADVIALLQSPVKNVISALQSGGNKLSGILKTLSEKSE
ncbi:MAG: 50S ribosomal protein L10 [Bacteroidales bacterium]|jgi:large subunit ribosomal protein L10